MSWKGHTTTPDEDQLVQQLEALSAAGNTDKTGFSTIMNKAVDLIEKLDNDLDVSRNDYEALKEDERILDLEAAVEGLKAQLKEKMELLEYRKR